MNVDVIVAVAPEYCVAKRWPITTKALIVGVVLTIVGLATLFRVND